MKRILILTTGGTIASLNSEEGLKPGNMDMKLILLDMIKSQYKTDYNITIKYIFNKDSSNIIPSDWYVVEDFIRNHMNDFDGIVILHGTDTMSYSAAMLSYLFIGLDKSIIITGSQIPIVHHGSDGIHNLNNAILTAADERLSGVFVLFHDKIINGTRAYKRSSINKDAYISCNYPYVGKIKDHKLLITDDYLQMKVNADTALANIPYKFEKSDIPKIFLLKIVPGVDAGIIDYIKIAKYEGVIIEGYGLGGMPVKNIELMNKIEDLIRSGIPVVMATQCVYDGVNLDTYEVGVTASKVGIIAANDMTSEAVYTKLMWILSRTNNYNDIVKALKTDFCGEITII